MFGWLVQTCWNGKAMILVQFNEEIFKLFFHIFYSAQGKASKFILYS